MLFLHHIYTNMSETIEKTIDIDKILAGKMGAKVKYVPRFLVKWLKHIIHQDEVNRFLWESRNLSGTEWLSECVRYLKMDVEIVGEENLLEDRIVKNVMTTGNAEGKTEQDFFGRTNSPFTLVNNKVIVPSEDEQQRNPRSRSAKLRIAEKK